MEELEYFAQEEWVNLEVNSSQVMRNLVSSFPRHLAAAIKEDGWYTKY
jgi:hypothetical protein